MNNAEQIAEWIKVAVVDKYDKDDKLVFVASFSNQQLILTCERVIYSNGHKHPHANLVWIENGKVELLYQTVIDGNEAICTVGNLVGEWGTRENLETIWVNLHNATKED